MLCLRFTNVLGQNIHGTIRTESGEAIPFASISILNSSLATLSDKEGNFSLSISQKNCQLLITAEGYSSTVRISSATDAALNITLKESSKTLSEIVVTANKRDDDIRKVPSSITSLSSEKITDTRTWGLGGLTALVPNYLYQELGVGFQQIQSIRGIQVFSENPAVVTYIDDVNNLDILANGFMLTDVERIEVLRGPQSTLFGRNAMGGVVNIITKKPTNKTEGFAEAGFGNLGLQRYGLGLKLPVVKDKLFFGLNALFQSTDGYFKNDTTGTGAVDGSANGKTVGGEKNLYGNLFLKWLPSNSFAVTVNVKAQTDWSSNTSFFVSQSSEVSAFANPDKINLARIGKHQRDIFNTSLNLKYYASTFTLTSISSLQTISLSFLDIDFPGFYHSYYKNGIGEKLPPQIVYNQEFRINSNTESRLRYTAGIYAFSQVGYEPSTNLAYELSPTTFIIYRNKSKNIGFAAFGEASYSLTDRLKVTAGIRYDIERREGTFNGFGDATFVNGVFTQLVPDTTVLGQYNALSPKFSITYDLTDQSSIYATYTRGFRAGGVNAQKVPVNVRQTFDPEFSNNYEVGYKVLAESNKFSLNFSAFLIQWQSLQFFNLVAPFTYARENVGNAQSYGIELETSAIPVKGLQIDASIGVNRTTYQNFDLRRVSFLSGIETVTPIGGNRLSNALAHSIFLGVQYGLPLSKKLRFSVRGEVRNIGEFYTDIQNTLKQPTYALLNTRIGLTFGKYGLHFWAQNITNVRYLAYGNPDTSFGRSVRMASPATFGVSLDARF